MSAPLGQVIVPALAIEMIRVGWGQVNTLEQTLAELRRFPPAGDD